MTLTSWVLDYVFTPLRMALRSYGDWGLAASVIITMTTLGAWHGLRWGYLAFGAINGIYLAASALAAKRRERFFANHWFWARLRPWYGPVLTYLLFSFSLIFFRARTLIEAWEVFLNLFRPGGAMPALPGLAPASLVVTGLSIATMEAVHLWRKRHGMSWPAEDWRQGLIPLAFYAVLFVFLLVGRPLATTRFIYLQF
jgi:D-alanyl-lipoteichoic acid acyltransferase DltB (MBOAT superfamily)